MSSLNGQPRCAFDAQTILLVEDNEDDVFLMQRAFQKSGLANPLAVVTDGDQAIAYLNGSANYGDRRQFPWPVLVLLDLNLPRKSGLEVLEEIRRSPPTRALPVYILSASARPIDVRRALETGANAYLVKPGRVDELAGLTLALQAFGRCQSFVDSRESGPASAS